MSSSSRGGAASQSGETRPDHGPVSEPESGCALVSSQIPAKTRTVPAATHAVNGSPSRITAIRMVDNGPMVPACAVNEAPIRSTAIMTISTGAKVQRVALRTESHSTAAGTAMLSIGLSNKNCAMHIRQATLVAKPVRRRAPSRCTSSPLYAR